MKNTWFKIGNFFMGSLAAAALLCGSPQRAEAAVLAEYLFNASTGASTDLDTGSTAGTFGSANLTTSFADPGFVGGDAVAFRATAGSMPTIQSVFFYFNFTITPTAGNLLNLSGTDALTFEFARNDGWGAGNEFNWAVRSSVDGFASDLATGATTAGAAWFPGSVDLSTAFNSQAGTVEFRFEVWDDGQTGAANFGYLDNVVLNGSVVPVPEPVNVALAVFGFCVAGVGLGRRFYRRAHA